MYMQISKIIPECMECIVDESIDCEFFLLWQLHSWCSRMRITYAMSVFITLLHGAAMKLFTSTRDQIYQKGVDGIVP